MITWIFSFLVIFGVSINWGLSVELVIKVTSPKLRSTAKAFFHLISHSLGDAPSPLIIGSIADYYMSKEPIGKSCWHLEKILSIFFRILHRRIQFAEEGVLLLHSNVPFRWSVLSSCISQSSFRQR